MKRITFFVILFFSVCTLATAHNMVIGSTGKITEVNKSQDDPNKLTAKDSLILSYLDAYESQLKEPEYKLYPTQNNWIFLLLNTRTGKIWQVQYSVDNSPRLKSVLNDEVRIKDWQENICGRFVLQETKNIYNFILLDQIDGRCWQVQWAIEKENRFVIRIY